MYNLKQKCWESGGYDEAVLLWCRESFNRDNPEALFTLADHMLAQAPKGKETADAVYWMQRSAELGYANGALAMGQMFQYGWAVHRSWKTAEKWYERAAALGSGEAAALLEKLRQARRHRLTAALLSVAGVVIIAAGAGILLRMAAGPQGILVNEDTVLVTPATLDEFNEALEQLVAQYDDELVISGMRSTNRLLLKFDGDGIDLTRFPAATVIADEDNYLVIQFASEEEAQRCLEALRAMGSVLFADMDEYSVVIDGAAPQRSSSGIPYVSPYTGDAYYTWGVEYLGLDQLAAWLKTQQTVPVTVAVLDTGSEPCDENRHRFLDGADMNQPGHKGWTDEDGHGTHVAGTIIDCTWGLDVSIFPVRVFKGNRAPTAYIVQGLKLAIQQQVDVINMSLGGKCGATGPDGDCGDPGDYYIHQAVQQGIVVVVAAGNDAEDSGTFCPAHLGDCIVVAACDDQGGIASFSNYGQSVDVCAPGVDVVSYYPGETLMALDGTSMASPHIAALAAMLKMYLPDKTPKQLEKYITDYCSQAGSSDRYGAGIPWAGYFAGN